MAVAASAAAISFLACIPLIYSYGTKGLAIAVAVQMLANIAVRGWFLARLFRGFALARHAARAFWPTVPAVGAVFLARLLEPGHRTVWVALGELALYIVVTIVCTWRFERSLVTEAAGYLRRQPAPA